MTESLTGNLKQNVPLSSRIVDAKKQISLWFQTLDIPFEYNKDGIRLERYEKRNGEYIYKYTIEKGVKRLRREIFNDL